jgi:hypothetical protein
MTPGSCAEASWITAALHRRFASIPAFAGRCWPASRSPFPRRWRRPRPDDGGSSLASAARLRRGGGEGVAEQPAGGEGGSALWGWGRRRARRWPLSLPPPGSAGVRPAADRSCSACCLHHPVRRSRPPAERWWCPLLGGWSQRGHRAWRRRPAGPGWVVPAGRWWMASGALVVGRVPRRRRLSGRRGGGGRVPRRGGRGGGGGGGGGVEVARSVTRRWKPALVMGASAKGIWKIFSR